MKHSITLMLMLLSMVSLAQFTFEGKVSTNEDYSITLYECEDDWNTAEKHDVPQLGGIFGQVNDFKLINLSNDRYIILFESKSFIKVVHLDLENLDDSHKLKAIIEPDSKTVMVKYQSKDTGLNWYYL